MLHTASPHPTESPEDEKEIIRPAVEGTLQVLRVDIFFNYNHFKSYEYNGMVPKVWVLILDYL